MDKVTIVKRDGIKLVELGSLLDAIEAPYNLRGGRFLDKILGHNIGEVSCNRHVFDLNIPGWIPAGIDIDYYLHLCKFLPTAPSEGMFQLQFGGTHRIKGVPALLYWIDADNIPKLVDCMSDDRSKKFKHTQLPLFLESLSSN